MRTRHLTPAILAAVMPVALGCGSPKQSVNSTPVDGAMRADADVTDWSGRLAPVGDGRVRAALRNDDESVYLALQSEDQGTIGQILALGLTVWFDPGGGTDRAFGVQYPVGLLNSDAAGSVNPAGAQQDPEQLRALLDRMSDEVVLRLKGEDDERWALQDVLALDARFDFDGEVFTLELRVPLATTWTRYAVGARPGDVVGIGIETPEIDRRAMAARFGGGPPPGGRPGGAPSEPPERLQFWLQVPLSGHGDGTP